MSFKELQNFLKELNIQVDDSYARRIFRVRQGVRAASVWQWALGPSGEHALSPAHVALQECDRSQTDSLEDEEIEAFYKMLTQREEIDRTFAEAAGSRETLSVDQLVTFLQHQQREEAAGPALALSLIERYEPSETGEGLAGAFSLHSLGLHWLGDAWGVSGAGGKGGASACPMKASRWETGLQHHSPSLGSFSRGV